MRRVVWSVLTGLGIFFLVGAALFRFYVPGQVVKFPVAEYRKSTLSGTGFSYFSGSKGTELSGVTMQATNTIVGNVVAANAAGSSHISVWQSFTAVDDITNHVPFQYSVQQLAFDRRTGQLVNCCGNYVGSNDHLHVAGQGYFWPFNAQKRTYAVFDTTLLRPYPVAYDKTAVVDGVSTYVYVSRVANQQIGTQTVPASLVGMAGTEVTLPEYYTATKTYWVDPVTGVPLKVSDSEQIALRDSSGAARLVLLDGTLTSTPSTVASGVATDKSAVSEINIVEVVVPLAAAILGIILLVVAFMLGRLRSDDQYEEYEAEPVGSSAF